MGVTEATGNRDQAAGDAETRGRGDTERRGTALTPTLSPGERGLPVSLSPGERVGVRAASLARRSSPFVRRTLIALVSVLSVVLSLAVLLVVDLLLFRNALVDGQIYYRSDTVTYYFPIANRLVDVLKEGRLLLWTRHIFGGFPLFADGEAGMLYPPHLLAYLLLPEQEAFIWLRIARHFLAAAFTFAYLRSLRLNGFAATVGSLTFAYGSFMVTQMHHTNVTNTALWLPLTLFMVEMALRSVRRWRWLWATFAGTSVGIQALGLHIQPLLMSGFFLALYVPFRVLLCPIAWPAPRKKRTSPRVLQPSQLAAAAFLLKDAYGALPAPGIASPDARSSSVDCRGGPMWPPSSGVATKGAHTGAPLPRRHPGQSVSSLRASISHRAAGTVQGIRDLLHAALCSLGVGIARLLHSARDLFFGRPLFGRRPLSAEPGDVWNTKGTKERESHESRFRAFRVAFAFFVFQAFLVVRRVLLWIARLVERAFHRTVMAALLLGMIPAIAFGIAAAQVLPLVELGFFSFRGLGVSFQFATSYSMPVQHLVNLLFPYFFRYTNRFYWSLWSEWETTLYVGIAPLALAAVAVLFARRRLVLFYLVAAAASLLLAFGNYSPYPLYEQFWQLPGFSSLRVPGRFTMLVTFSVAVLAAFGVDWLCKTLRPLGARERRSRWDRLSRLVGAHGFALYLLGLLAAMAGVVWWMMSLRLWIEKEPWAVKKLVEESYLSLRNSKPWLTSDMVLNFLNYSLDPTNEKTSLGLALMLATFLLLFCWFAFRWLWRVWATILVALVAADMLLFAMDFHPTVHINQLTNPDSAARWLMAQNSNGMDRVYTAREVRKTEANKLLPFQVSDITGYSSLETTRHQEYMGKVAEFEKTLLDLYGVRFVVLPKRFPALPSYEYTAFHPDRPLAEGPSTNRGAHVTFYMNPPVKADEVGFISHLRNAVDIPQDADVADIVVVDTNGERVTLKVKAGRDTGENALDRPDVIPHAAHKKPPVASKVWTTDRDGRRYEANLYFGEAKLDKTRTVSRVEFHYTHPKGSVRLYGMMLWENPRTAHQVVGRDKFIPRYEDDEVVIMENPSRLPHAFLVPTMRVLKQPEIMETMVHGDFDPEKVALLETRETQRRIPVPDTALADPEVESRLRGNSDTRPGTAEIVDYQSTEVAIRTESDRNALLVLSDSYYPGWKATMDGEEVKIYRANYLSRAVLVPQGKHEVRFVFEPESFALGREISTFTLSTLGILWVLLLPVVYLFRGARWFLRWIRTRRSVAPAR